MDSLIKAAENFDQKSSVEEPLDEKLFVQFMKKVGILWYYKAIISFNVRTRKER